MSVMPLDPNHALAWATKKHGAQRYGVQPYEDHLRAVVHWVRHAGGSPTALAAAALHDVVEDVPEVTVELVSETFGEEVARIVAALSKPPRGTPDRLIVYFRGIRDAGAEARIVKVADRVANVEASAEGPNQNGRLLDKYRGEASLFETWLRVEGELEALWSRLEQLLRADAAAGRP